MLQFNPGVNTGGFARDSPSSYERVIGSPTTTYSSYSSYSPSYEVRLNPFPLHIPLLFLTLSTLELQKKPRN